MIGHKLVKSVTRLFRKVPLGLIGFVGIFTPLSLYGAQPPPKICMVLDRGGKDDRSFNESAVKGFNQAKEKLAISPESKFVEPTSETIIPQFFTNFATSAKCDLIIGVGFLPLRYAAKCKEVSSKS